MNTNSQAAKAALEQGHTLAAADQILIDPTAETLVARVEALIEAIQEHGQSLQQVCKTLLQLGMNFVGRDAEIVGYGVDEIDDALEQVLTAVDAQDLAAMASVVADFLAEMKSVNLADSLSGLLAERIEPELDASVPGRSFLLLLKENMRSGIYWRMIGEEYCKYGNDFARGLELLRHYGFCQVSTNPVLAAKAFDEDPALTDELKVELQSHPDWLQQPDAHADEIAMAATLIALWPNLAIFRPLARHMELKDYMVSFQLNPNIADQADASIEDARQAYKLADDFLRGYDGLLGVPEEAGTMDPNIVFKVGAGHEAARKITVVLNSEGIGTNNTVVYTVGQEVQLVLDAFEGKAKSAKQGGQVVRTYETNMGGRFVSHLREVESEKLYVAVAEKAGKDKANALLDALAASLGINDAVLESIADADVANRAKVIGSYKYLKSLDQPDVVDAAEVLGQTAEDVQLLEADLKKAGTLVARRVYWVFYAPENRAKWIVYLTETYGVTEAQAAWILDSMDVLPASKRVPEDTLDAMGKTNMCHTEFPNHSRAVQIFSEQEGFCLEDLRQSVLQSYEPGVAERLYPLPDFPLGYDLTPSLKQFLTEKVGIHVADWQTGGIEPANWPDFGSVQKTSAEFKTAYDTFAAKCVAVAKEVAG